MEDNVFSDHLNKSPGFIFKPYIDPPRIKMEDIELFSDEILEAAKTKVVQIRQRISELKRQRDACLISNELEDWESSETKEISRLLCETKFDGEYEVLKKWEKYWYRLIKIITQPERDTSNEITPEKIAQAKEVPIDSLYTGELKRVGGRFTGLCPFHTEKTPSFFIFESTNSFYCFGCKEHGDSVTFVMKSQGYNFIDAVKSLCGLT